MKEQKEEGDEQDLGEAVKDLCKFLRYLFFIFLIGGVATYCNRAMVSPAPTPQKEKR